MTREKHGASPHLTAAPLVEAADQFLPFLLREQVGEEKKSIPHDITTFCIRSGPPSIRIFINVATTNLEFLFATDDLTFGARKC